MPARQIKSTVPRHASAQATRSGGIAAAVWMAASSVAALLLAAISLFLLSGCTWTGKGKDVADALQKTGEVKTAMYAGSFSIQAKGNAGSENMEIIFNGAADDSNPAAPRMSMDMTIMGQRMSTVAPGDGNIYITTSAGTYGAPYNATQTGAQQNSFAGVMGSLESAIGNFREAAASTTDQGLTLKTIAADGNVGRICGKVLPAFSAYSNASSAGSGSLKGLGKGTSIEDMCRQLLKKDPTLWFGIDADGYLRMIAMKATLSVMALGSVDMTMRFDVTSINQPVTFHKPSNAKMLGSQADLAAAVGSGGS